MKKNKKIVCLSLILLFLIGLFSINYIRVRADSGWDSSYDSDSGSSSWDSSSSSSSYSSSNSSNNKFNKEDSWKTIKIIILWISPWIVITIVAVIDDKIKRKRHPEWYILNTNVDIPGFNESEFLDLTYKLFVDVQNAWSSFDYDTLQKLLSDELYNTYKTQLKALSLKKEKNVMHGFELVSNKIHYYFRSEKEYTIETELKVKFYDYVVDSSNKVVRGQDANRLIMTYHLTFIKSVCDKDNKCPNCKAPLEYSASSICPYCKSTIICDCHDFVLSKKQAISQKNE